MARDYKHRANQRKKPAAPPARVSWWKWFLIILIFIAFSGFLYFLKTTPTEQKMVKPLPEKSKNRVKVDKAEQAKTETHYDFYTILPEKEVVVPDHEINMRSRESDFGKVKPSQYVIQAGSFKNYAEADKLRAELAFMGVESKIEKARIGNVTWNRVKIGPYKQAKSVTVIKRRLKKNHIDAVVIELKN